MDLAADFINLIRSIIVEVSYTSIVQMIDMDRLMNWMLLISSSFKMAKHSSAARLELAQTPPHSCCLATTMGPANLSHFEP